MRSSIRRKATKKPICAGSACPPVCRRPRRRGRDRSHVRRRRRSRTSSRRQQAVPGSGKGLVIGYATSLEAVPIVHVISNGIKAQAKRAGAKLVFCDTGGDLAKALDCAKSMKTQGVQGILQFQHVTKASPAICKAGPQGVPVLRDRHPPAAVPDLVHGRRQRLRRLRGRREGRRDGQGQVELQVRRVDLARGARDRRPERRSAWAATARASSRSAPARSRTSRRSASTRPWTRPGRSSPTC